MKILNFSKRYNLIQHAQNVNNKNKNLQKTYNFHINIGDKG